MTARKITRRRVVAGAAAAVALGAVPAAARPRFRGGKGRPSPPTPPSGDGMSRTFVNTSASPTSANWSLLVMMHFVKGDVPAGQIAEPAIGGVVQNYNINIQSIQHWDDGSQKLGAYVVTRNSSLAAGGLLPVEFVVAPGTYTTTSAITESTFTSEADLKWRISNVHTAQTALQDDKLFTPLINPATGQVTGAKVVFPTNMSIVTVPSGAPAVLAVTGAGGIGGQISITNGITTVVSPGSGYGLVGAGTFTAAFNTIISAVASGGNYANGVSWRWLMRGQACDAIEGSIVLHDSIAHYHAQFYVYRHKKPDGTLLDYSFNIRGMNGVVSSVNIPNYTYDLDIMNGASVIRGAGTGYEPHKNYLNCACNGLMSMDASALPDWLSGAGASSNAVIPYLTPDECLYMRRAGVWISPWNENEIPRATPTVTNYFDNAFGIDGVLFVGRYRPGGTFGMRHGGQNGGGAFNLEQAFDEVTQNFWLACYHQDLPAAKVWYNNMLVQAACAANSANTGGGRVIEPTTTYIPNIIPSADRPPGAMLPTRQTSWAGPPQMNSSGWANPLLFGPGPGAALSALGNTSHQYGVSLGPYLFTGHDWMRDNVIHGGTCAIHAISYSGRVATFGGRKYYGVITSTDVPTNIRIDAWYTMRLLQALAVLPEGDIQRDYVERIALDKFDYMLNLPGYIGTIVLGQTTRPKTIDFSNAGTPPEMYYHGANQMAIPFMDEYEMLMLYAGAWVFRGTALGAKIRAYRDYRNIYFLGLRGGAGPAYYSDQFRIRIRRGPDGGAVNLNNGINPANPDYAVAATGFPTTGNGAPVRRFSTTAGSTTLTLAGSIILFGATELGNGARVFITSVDTELTSIDAREIPAGFEEDFPYWYQRIDSTHFRLCLDAAFTQPVTALETSPGFDFNFWMVPQAWPQLADGFGTRGNGVGRNPAARLGNCRGILHMAKSFSLPGDDTTKLDIAISRFDAGWAAIGGGLYHAWPWIPTSYTSTR